jgi:hypothetical protein
MRAGEMSGVGVQERLRRAAACSSAYRFLHPLSADIANCELQIGILKCCNADLAPLPVSSLTPDN